MLEWEWHKAIRPRGSEDIYGIALMGVVFKRSLDAACQGVVLPEEEPDDCCNYDFDEDRGTAPGVRGHCFVPGTRRYEI